MTCDRSVVFSANKTDRHDITEILLKVTLNNTAITPNSIPTNELYLYDVVIKVNLFFSL